MSKLNVVKVKAAKPGRHADGGGLYLQVKPPSPSAKARGEKAGSKSWILRVRIDGQRRDIGLGSAAEVTLAEARAAAIDARRLVKQGKDPGTERKRVKASVVTFEEAARACHKSMKAGWRSERHRATWLIGLEHHIFPQIGNEPVADIDSIKARNAIEPIWLTIPETARRVLQRISVVLDYAHVKGWRPEEATLRSVRKGLAEQPTTESHFEAMPFDDVPAFVARVAVLPETVGRDALIFTIHTAVRPNETRFAVWSEFDLTKGTWSIPAARMKMEKAHEVPLSPPVLALLRRRRTTGGADDAWVFSSNARKPISDNTMTKVLRDDGINGITVHGFRSTFTDWAAEMTDVPKEVVDKALAHKIPDKVEAAYRRTDFFNKRQALMDHWAAYLAGGGHPNRSANLEAH